MVEKIQQKEKKSKVQEGIHGKLQKDKPLKPRCLCCGLCCLLDIRVSQSDGTKFTNPTPHKCVNLKIEFVDGKMVGGKCLIFGKPERADECKNWYCYGKPHIRCVEAKGVQFDTTQKEHVSR